MKWLALFFSLIQASAALMLPDATYSFNFRVKFIPDSPTNYTTLGVWHLAEDLQTNNGALVNAYWTNRAIPSLRYLANGTDIYYSNQISAVPHLISMNAKGAIVSGASGYTNKAGVPTAGNGFTWILFGRMNTNPAAAPLLWKSDTTEQFRLGITTTNEISAFVNGVGTFTVSAGNALTNAGYRVIGMVYSNTQARGYQNMTMATLNTLGVNLAMNTLELFVDNVDVVEFMVWTNNALNATQYSMLYTNYFKWKYPNAGL